MLGIKTRKRMLLENGVPSGDKVFKTYIGMRNYDIRAVLDVERDLLKRTVCSEQQYEYRAFGNIFYMIFILHIMYYLNIQTDTISPVHSIHKYCMKIYSTLYYCTRCYVSRSWYWSPSTNIIITHERNTRMFSETLLSFCIWV